MTTVIWSLLFLAPFYFNYSMRKVGAYKLFNMTQKIGFIIGFMFVTCRGAFLLFEQFHVNRHGGLLALYCLSFIVHLMVSIGKVEEEYQEDAHYPH